jgi:F-type H+-transporting ATPase subunit gamma
MHSPRDLRRRIKSIGGTAQITRAMQMVAASKMRKAQQAAIAARPFARLIYRIQRDATTQAVGFTHPLLEVRDVRRRAVLPAQFDPQTTVFLTAGRKAAQFVARTGRSLAAEFAYGDAPTFPEARAMAACARDLFLSGEVDQVQIVTTRFVNTLTQDAICVEYLPVGEIRGLKVPGVDTEEDAAPDAATTVFEPRPAQLLDYLLGHYLNIYVYFVLLNAKASEQSARMVSMKNATDSAESLIESLKLEYNKLRQGAITTELLEIAGGRAE